MSEEKIDNIEGILKGYSKVHLWEYQKIKSLENQLHDAKLMIDDLDEHINGIKEHLFKRLGDHETRIKVLEDQKKN